MQKQIVLFLLIVASQTLYSQSDSTQNKWYDNFKLTGYFQFQYHYSDKDDSVSLHSISAGDFSRFNNNKFMVRRSRIRVEYEKSFAASALSFDVTERGILIKDAWLKLKENKWNAIQLSTGVFALPFGHEIELQSMDRETPERSRVIQTIFPGIRDIGAAIQFRLPENNSLHFLQLDAGIFHGTHGNIESDNAKDFVTRLKIDRPLKNDFFNFSLAYSNYYGRVNHQYDIDGSISNYHYIYRTIDTTFLIDGAEQTQTIMFQDYLPNELDELIRDSVNPITPATHNTYVTRKYHAISGQIDLDLKIKKRKIGKTTIRGEYIWGDQVSQEGTLGNPYVFTSQSPTGPFMSVTWPKFDSPQPYNPAGIGMHLKPSHTFVREFMGLYVYLDQQIGNTGHHFVYKYDFYDPNTRVKGEQIRLNILDNQGLPFGSTGLSPADIAYTTHGFGYRYVFNENLSIMAYYEKPINEITQLEPLSSTQINLGKFPSPGFLTDIKDDVITFRIQYIF
jgi:hypothetical protein